MANILGQEIICFSWDNERQFHLDASSMQYYYPPSLPANLCDGFDTFKKWDDSIDEHLVGLLRALMALEQKSNQKLTTDFITWRGMMTKIMAAPFDRFGG
jgi:RAT1-interacting protein